ncbi:hypothetical protein [Oligella urethralis]|uniref:Uncharacterized protein n=1 Tax=Oligella urethralis DNF00040 TaxID=1401065 RepID=A0A095ZAP8_9BURK|nr:hypothetical protein [Oligella urethralis]KGF31820.1 hypothetical protein HMPREF2130_02085 [Oligella urethralis DNF00040]
MSSKAPIRSIYSVNKNDTQLQASRHDAVQDALSMHPSFSHQYSHNYVTLYKRRPSSFLSKLKSIDMARVGDVLGVVLWAVSIPFVFSLAAVAVV